MELIQYIRLFKRRFWLLFLGAFIVGGVGFAQSTRQVPRYRAQTIVSIGGFIQSPDPDFGEIQTGVQLAQTYAELVKTFDVLQATADSLDLPFPPNSLRGLITTRILPNTSLMEIRITYTDPILSADIANQLAEQLIINSPSNLTPEQEAQISLASSEIETLTTQVQEARLQLELIDSQIDAAEVEEDIQQLTNQRNALVSQINQASATMAQFSNSIASLQQRTNSIDIVERAQVPTHSISTATFRTTILAIFVGLSLAAGVALLLEYLDDTIHTSEEAAHSLGLPVLASIAQYGKSKASYAERLITNFPSSSPVSEGYRTLRTNLLFASKQDTTDVHIITSPGPEEGKTITATNLAITLASTGLRVLLIDADLRRPKVHEAFQLKNDIGLSTLLTAQPANGSNPPAYTTARLRDTLNRCIQNTSIPNLSVITSGFIPHNPAEILGSTLMERLIQLFRKSPQIDIILIDTPPTLIVADSSIVAKATQADIVMVIKAKSTHRLAALKAKEQITHLNHPIRGIVINGSNPQDEGYYNYGPHGYYAPKNQSSLRERIFQFLPIRLTGTANSPDHDK